MCDSTAYVTQGHRFNIFEQAGCYPWTYNTPVAFVFVWTWPLIIGLISAFYCFMTIRAFYRRRAQFKELLSANNNLDSGRYFRLMGLASIDLLCTIPLSAYLIQQNIAGGIEPWISWENVHSNFSRVVLIPALIWRNNAEMRSSVERTRWLTVVCCFVFFAFFGFADEARKNYRSAFESFAKKVGYTTGSVGSGATSTSGPKTGFPGMTSFGRGMASFGKASLPVFVRRETTRTTDADLTSSAYTEKDSVRISVGSVFEDYKAKDFAATATTTSSSSASHSSRSPSPTPQNPRIEPALFTPPNHNTDSPHDIV
jgi:pheromone a factor receptor